MAKHTDFSEVAKYKKDKKTKKLVESMAKKLIAVVLIATAACALVLTRDIWYPKLDGIVQKIPLTAQENTGELAEGEFPIKISGGSDYQLLGMSSYFAMLDEMHLYIYDLNGNLNAESQHDYANPVMSVSGKRVLVYDLGGKKFRVENRHKTIFEKDTEDAILFAKISSNDNTAVVTRPGKALSALSVYNQNGEFIFGLTSNDMRIIDVSFTEYGDGLIVTTMGASGGDMVSKMTKYRFGQKEPVWVSDTVNTMAMSVQPVNGGVMMFGDNKCVFFDSDGNYKTSFEYKNTLVDFGCSSDMTAILFKDQERRRMSLMMINNADYSVNELFIDGDANDLTVSGSEAYVLTQGGVKSYYADGTEGPKADLENEYDGFVKIGNYIYLLGYDEINRIDFSG